MNWLLKIALTNRQRVQSNIERLESLLVKVHELGYFAFASQSGSYQVLQNLTNDKLVLGRPRVHDILKSALTGENNQKLVLDSPYRFQRYMIEAESVIKREIADETRELQALEG